jgi:hypothetical protein
VQSVADRLSEWAIELGTDPSMDVFGRSAFNRYYYSAYLKMRQTLYEMDNSYARTPHASIPGLLEGGILKRIRKELQGQQKAKLIGDSRASVLRHDANTAAAELGNILRTAYQVRVIADYSPEVGVVFANRRQFSLNGTHQGSARTWSRRVEHFGGMLLNVWKSLGLS